MPLFPPAPPYWRAGTSPNSGDFNVHIRNDIQFLSNPPIFRAWQQVVQSIPGTGVGTTLTLDTVLEDTYSGWVSGASNKYVAQVDGLYMVIVTYFSNGGSGAGNMATSFVNSGNNFNVGGTALGGQKYPIATTTGWGVQTAVPVFMFAGTSAFVQPQGWQNSGGALNTFSNGLAQSCAMEVVWISK